MADSTTEHRASSPEQGSESQPVVLDKTGVDVGTDVTDTAEATETETAATDDARAAARRPKRGRRARRAAAARSADAQEQDDVESETSASEVVPGPEDAATAKAASIEKRGSRASGARSKTGVASKTGQKIGSDRKSGPVEPSGVAAKSRRGRIGSAGGAPALGGRRLGRIIVALLVLAILLAAILLTQLIKGPGSTPKLEAREDRREAARQAADAVIPKLYSYDYRQIDANTAEQIQLTTGTISDQIRNDTAPALKQLAPKSKAIVQAVSLGSAVLDDNGQDVQVLVFLNQAVSSTLLPAPRLDRNRVVATMRLVDGEWKVADIKAL